MEHLITSLLQRFEEGTIGRRQLIKSLVAATSAASIVGLNPARAAEKNLKATAINHISYQSADYRKMRDFYSSMFGMRVADDNGTLCRLYFGDCQIIVRNGPVGGKTPLVDHIAYSLENWDKDAVFAELSRRGLNPKPESEVSLQIKDPDGYHVQLMSSARGTTNRLHP